MFGFIGSHFVVFAVAAFGAFTCALGYQSIVGALARKR
jgi:hypothetical protein